MKRILIILAYLIVIFLILQEISITSFAIQTINQKGISIKEYLGKISLLLISILILLFLIIYIRHKLNSNKRGEVSKIKSYIKRELSSNTPPSTITSSLSINHHPREIKQAMVETLEEISQD